MFLGQAGTFLSFQARRSWATRSSTSDLTVSDHQTDVIVHRLRELSTLMGFHLSLYSQTCELRPPKGLAIRGPISQVVSFARLGFKFFNMELYTCR